MLRYAGKWSVLHHASFHGHAEVLELLLSRQVRVKGGDFVNLKDRWNRTALSYAVINAHAAAFKVLLAHGGALNERGEKGRLQPQLARQRRSVINKLIN